MTDDKIQAAMSIVLNAGDARLANKYALEAMAQWDFAAAEDKMKLAHEKITAAHKTQTDAIQEEAAGGEQEYSLLFTHAQDHLMTVNSEIVITKQILKICKSLDARLSALEGGESHA